MWYKPMNSKIKEMFPRAKKPSGRGLKTQLEQQQPADKNTGLQPE
jgi:hypothetical protein